MKTQLFGYDENIYGDLDDAQENGAIYLLSKKAKDFTYDTFNTVSKAAIESVKAFADKNIVVFIKAGGMDYNHEAISHELAQDRKLTIGEIANIFRSKYETDFKVVRARIIWCESGEFETVTISNTSQYIYMDACSFCGSCLNCQHDENIFYYTDGLTELDELTSKPHLDGWMIKSFSVMD